jgi:hypothetical protein
MYNYNDDDFEIAANGKKVLKDGRRLTIPLQMRDAARSTRRGPVFDAMGRTAFDPAFFRPGYRFSGAPSNRISMDAAAVARDAKEAAYRDHANYLQNAWRNLGKAPEPRRDDPISPSWNADALRAARDVAYKDYERRQTQAYRDSHWPPPTSSTAAPAGSYPLRREVLGRPCTKGGRPGRFVERNGWMVCEINGSKDAAPDDIEAKLEEIRRAVTTHHEGAAGEDIADFLADFGDDDVLGTPVEDFVAAYGARRRLRGSSRRDPDRLERAQSDARPSLADQRRKHAELMAREYAARDAEMRDAWKHPT